MDLNDALSRLAPGTALREGIERVMRAGRGTLIVVGFDEQIDALCSGGLDVDVAASPQRLSELAKMDGALVLSDDGSRIVKANVHLVPSATVPTAETGTRHRSGERAARQTGRTVIAVSESQHAITVYVGAAKHTLEDVTTLLFRANQALATLERYCNRFDDILARLDEAEVAGGATLSDVVACIQRGEMGRRIVAEIERQATELGTEGRLVSLQLEELAGPLRQALADVMHDYSSAHVDADAAQQSVTDMPGEQLLDADRILAALGHPRAALDRPATSRGLRFLRAAGRVPDRIADKVTAHFDTLDELIAADVSDLSAIDGVGEFRARQLHQWLDQHLRRSGARR